VTNSRRIPIVKAHGYGNDFLLVRDGDAAGLDPRSLTRAVCNRHTGIGADGLIFFAPAASSTPASARMRLINSDGSDAEVSGNGVRCLAALLAEERGLVDAGAIVRIETDAGPKRLELVGSADGRVTFRAAMGRPADITREPLLVAGETIDAVILSMGNPQCVVLGTLPSRADFLRLGPALEHHPRFRAGTNVEFAEVRGRDDVRILIWERGAGETQSSGTGSCAAAVAAATCGGAARDVQVSAPGGTQRVEWLDDEVYLTGWAELVVRGEWIAQRP
jgi:diaminopimelate epimerase